MRSKQDENHHEAGADLVALHRSYKMMENDKVRYMEESKNIIKRQTQVANTLSLLLLLVLLPGIRTRKFACNLRTRKIASAL